MIARFLKAHLQSAENIDEKEIIKSFTQQMVEGLEGKPRSLKMLPTYLYEPDLSAVSDSGKKIVIDAGGTNFRSALGEFKDGKAEFTGLQKGVMPASDRELSKDEFYGEIADNVKRLLNKGGDVGFCFSYPVEMGADGDGEMGAATKELKAKGIEGTKVGECTLNAIKKYDTRKRKIVILNDTVATLLGGMACAKGGYSAYIGYIYGTGINLAYLENSSAIKKIKVNDSRRMIINTECGNFDGFVQGDFDKEVASRTEQPRAYLFEKFTSGKYLAKVMEKCLDGAEREGLLKRACAHPFELKDVSAFLTGERSAYSENFAAEDLGKAKRLAEALIDRAAKAGAAVNAAAAIRSGVPGGLPVAIVAEGTTFEKLYGYKRGFCEYLKEFLTPYGISYELIKGEDTNLLGSLMAAACM